MVRPTGRGSPEGRRHRGHVAARQQLFQAGNIKAEIAPGYLEKADILVLRMIKDNTGRPIYFSRTTGDYAHRLGLGPYLLTQGFARKLLPNVPTAGRDTVLAAGEGFVDDWGHRDWGLGTRPGSH